MRRSTVVRGWVLVGLLIVSLTLYWAADSGSTTFQAVLLGLLGALSLFAVWLWR